MGILILLAAIMICLLAFLIYSYRICFYVGRDRNDDINEAPKGSQYQKWGPKMVEIARIMESAKCEIVTVKAWDGLMLSGRLYEYHPGAPLILAFHGYRSMALRDCAGAFALAQKLGFNILAVDQRSHGKSEGNAVTFGIRERYDCLDWIQYACERYGRGHPIVLSGISMGAATVLSAAELDLPENVCCILADCPYSSPAAIIEKVAKDRGYPGELAMPVIRLGAKLLGGFDLDESGAADAVRQTKMPILLIHGEDDRFVPCDMSREISSNCGCKIEFYTFPDAGHGLCYIMDPKRYEKICVDFLWNMEPLHPALEQSEFARKVHAK